MIYDTLFALDGNLEVKPQMVDKWTSRADHLTWTFTLRDGLEFHDGTPVTSEDVMPSLKRWAARMPYGQLLWTKVAEVKALDPKTFQIQLKAPTGIMLAALGQPSGARLHHAQEGGRDRSVQADRRLYRLGAVHLREGPVEAGRQDGLRQEPQVQAAVRAGLGPGRRQDRQGRSRRMGRHPRPADGDERADQGRDRHDRIAAARSVQGDGGRSQREAGQPQQVGQPVHLPLQLPLSAVRQRQGAAGLVLRLQPEGLPRRRDRRSQVLQGVQGDVHVRHALCQHQGLRGQARQQLRQGEGAGEGVAATTASRSS